MSNLDSAYRFKSRPLKKPSKSSAFRSSQSQIERLEQRVALTGDLRFHAPLAVQLGNAATEIRWQIQADFDGDGRSDIAAGSGGVRENLHVALSLPDNSFHSQRFELGESAQGAAGDLDGDGDIDLVVAETPDIRLLLNEGVDEDGSWLGFGGPQTVQSRATETHSIQLEDVDANGKLDILVATGLGVHVQLNSELGFSDPITYLPELRGTQKGMTVGDFDQDGDVDIAVATSEGWSGESQGQLSLLLGQGDGTFEQSPVSYPVGAADLTAGDFDDDGDLDLALAQNYSYDDNVAVMMGHGDGTFELSEKQRIIGSPKSVMTDDINRDGILDLLIGHGSYLHLEDYGNGPGGVSYLLGTATGSFQSPVRLMSSEGSLSVGDINGDGVTDPASFGYAGDRSAAKVLVAAPDSPSYFEWHSTLTVENGPTAIELADVNADGTNDLVLTHRHASRVTLLHSNGDATFDVPQDYRVGRFPIATLPADFNADSITDLATVNESDISLLLGRGDGTFTEEIRHAAGKQPAEHAQLDVNSDGQVDLLVVNHGSNDLSLMLGAADGTFQEDKRIPVGSGPVAIAIDDLNGDDRSDFVVANSESNDVSVILSASNGGFEPTRHYAVGERPSEIALIDADLDGALDVAVAHEGSSLFLLHNQGDGQLASGQPAYLFDQATIVHSVKAADVNGDGVTDLVVGADNDAIFMLVYVPFGESWRDVLIDRTPYRSQPRIVDYDGDGLLDILNDEGNLYLYRGNGEGSFANRRFVQSLSFHWVEPVFTDLNSDNLLDVLQASGDQIGVRWGTGPGEFAQWEKYSGGIDASSASAADVNGDGHSDIIITNRSSGDISVVFGTGDGMFATPTRFLTGSDNTMHALMDDLNLDGHPDIVSADYQTISISLGDGDGTVGEPSRKTTSGLDAIMSGDFNLDGLPDIASINYETVSVYAGSDDGSFAQPIVSRRSGGGSARHVLVTDLNGDGKDDLILSQMYEDSIEVLLGNGDGTFAAANSKYSVGENPRQTAVADLNFDGIKDIVVASSGLERYPENDLASPGGSYSILIGVGGGEYAPAVVHYFSENDFRGLAIDDFDQDGDGDLVLVNAHGVTVLLHEYVSPGDFNADGRLDATDIDFLFAAIRDPQMKDLSVFDLNSDDQIDRSDADYWVRQLRHAQYGDVNFDGRVSFDDFLILSAHFGTTGASWSNGDFDGDTEVSFEDFLLMADAFGKRESVAIVLETR